MQLLRRRSWKKKQMFGKQFLILLLPREKGKRPPQTPQRRNAMMNDLHVKRTGLHLQRNERRKQLKKQGLLQEMLH